MKFLLAAVTALVVFTADGRNFRDEPGEQVTTTTGEAQLFTDWTEGQGRGQYSFKRPTQAHQLENQRNFYADKYENTIEAKVDKIEKKLQSLTENLDSQFLQLNSKIDCSNHVSECVGEGIRFGTQCLTFIGAERNWNSGEALNFYDAVAACAANGGRLATIEHPQDVQTYLRDHVDNHRFWTGATDTANEGSWVWMDGQPLDVNFPGWRSGGTTENCMTARGSGESFIDLPCSYLNRYICEQVDPY